MDRSVPTLVPLVSLSVWQHLMDSLRGNPIVIRRKQYTVVQQVSLPIEAVCCYKG
jgi:hypothetical protein